MKYDSASLQLKTLQWLPIVQRAKFKALLLSHKLAHNDMDVPAHFKDHDTQVKIPTRFTRPDSSFHPKLVSSSLRCFQSCGVDLWNGLPDTIFATLKTTIHSNRQ